MKSFSKAAPAAARLAAGTFATAVCALAAGCFTVHSTPYPESLMTPAGDGGEVRVALSGFEATVTTYLPVSGSTTVWREGPGYYRHGRYHSGFYGPETYTTTTYVPQVSETPVFAERAVELLEDAGYTVAATNADYMVEVRFSGPEVNGGDRTASLLWVVCSLLSADYGAQTWTAKLRIRDGQTGKLLMHHEYSQKYSAAVWGPIPIFSPAFSDVTSSETMQSWCLSALTDRTMADASAFLASRRQ